MLDRTERFEAIDALRGLAALLVLAFHLFRSSPMTGELDAVAPVGAAAMLDVSRNGVAVFFVISGFVITWTTRRLGSGLGEAGNYSLRRQLRLDPPYYLVMLVAVAAALAERWVPGLDYRTITPGQVVANLFYVQGFTGQEPILAVAWTLCYEVQFYLVVVLVAMCSRWTGGARATTAPLMRPSSRLIFAALAAVSFALPFTGLSAGPWFIGSWWMFFAGMCVAWFFARDLSWVVTVSGLGALALWCLAVDLFATQGDPFHGQWAAWATALVIAVLIRSGKAHWRPPRPLMFFGAISYSLYLVHLPVLDTLVAALYKVLPHTWPTAVALYVIGAALCIGLAVVLNRLVERPAMWWSAHF